MLESNEFEFIATIRAEPQDPVDDHRKDEQLEELLKSFNDVFRQELPTGEGRQPLH
jgi:hypothetical protein